MTDRRGEVKSDSRGAANAEARASAATVSIVFVGLLVVSGFLAGGFYIAVTGGEEGGDPVKVELAASTCTVATDGDTAGVGTVTLSARYLGEATVDLSDAKLRYADERAEATLDLGNATTSDTARIRNDSGAYDATIAEGTLLSIVVPVEAVRGGPLPPGERAKLELVVDAGTIASTSIRTPSGVGPGQSFVDC